MAVEFRLSWRHRSEKLSTTSFCGLYHGSLVVFDGGSSLADHGLIKIVDDAGMPFVRHLHEIGFKAYDKYA